LALREQGLCLFEDTPNLQIADLAMLEYLSLSHNKIINIYEIGKLVNLLELNLNFNQITDISPVAECLNLEKLWASNNSIKSIRALQDLTKLKVLGLYKNKIADFDETVQTLSQLPDLKELDLDKNPCTRKFSYKYDVLCYVKVEYLDGDKITDMDFDLAKTFKHNNLSFQDSTLDTTAISNPLQRPSTAPGRLKKNSFVDKLKNSINISSISTNLIDIPENINFERLGELEHENENVQERKRKIKRRIRHF